MEKKKIKLNTNTIKPTPPTNNLGAVSQNQNIKNNTNNTVEIKNENTSKQELSELDILTKLLKDTPKKIKRITKGGYTVIEENPEYVKLKNQVEYLKQVNKPQQTKTVEPTPTNKTNSINTSNTNINTNITTNISTKSLNDISIQSTKKSKLKQFSKSPLVWLSGIILAGSIGAVIGGVVIYNNSLHRYDTTFIKQQKIDIAQAEVYINSSNYDQKLTTKTYRLEIDGITPLDQNNNSWINKVKIISTYKIPNKILYGINATDPEDIGEYNKDMIITPKDNAWANEMGNVKTLTDLFIIDPQKNPPSNIQYNANTGSNFDYDIYNKSIDKLLNLLKPEFKEILSITPPSIQIPDNLKEMFSMIGKNAMIDSVTGSNKDNKGNMNTTGTPYLQTSDYYKSVTQSVINERYKLIMENGVVKIIDTTWPAYK